MMRLLKYILLGVLLAGATGALSADSVSLWSGESYKNVRLLYGGRLVIIIFADGKVKKVPSDQISSTEFAAVNWDRPDLKDQIARLQRQVFRMAKVEEIRDGSLWRSALYPGWGHDYSGSKGIATIYMTVSAALLAKFALDWRRQIQIQREYDEVGLPIALSLLGPSGFFANIVRFEDLKNRMDAKARTGNQALLAYGIFWVWNLFDLYNSNDPEKVFDATTADSGFRGFDLAITGDEHERGVRFMFQTRF